MDGNTTQDIAKARARSYTTVRTQFQSILEKTGCRTQAELLRTALSIAEFSEDIRVISDTLNHPHRRRTELFLEGGRIVEATMMGDLKGLPLINITNAVCYTFDSVFEQALYRKGLYVISLCLPGYGATDPVPKGRCRLMRIKEDLEALLKQLNIERCGLLATNTSSPVAFKVAGLLPAKISCVVQLSACPPPVRYSLEHGTQSSWASAILKATDKHPAIKQFFLKAGLKARAAIGAEKFMKMQMSGNEYDASYALRPANLQEYENALKTATKFGVDALYEDSVKAFEDWSEEVKKCSVPITIIHGVEDHVFPIAGIRTFANDYPDKITLIEQKEAGFTLLQSHPEWVTDTLADVTANRVTIVSAS